MKILVVSDLSSHALGNLYIAAFKACGHEVAAFDVDRTIEKYSRYGMLGKKINLFWPVDAWCRKGNRELALECINIKPEIVIIFGIAQVMYGALAFLKSIHDCTVALYWPDTLLNLKREQADAMPLYDLVATYSEKSIPLFKALGSKSQVWLPFAGDVSFLGKPTADQTTYDYDVSFAGGWRPEREKALKSIIENTSGLTVTIRGTSWERFCKDKKILNCCNPTPLYGQDFGDLIRSSRINLNVIDDTNYPAANMRFFEIPAAGGLQLSSECPEMTDIFRDGEHILSFKDEDEMLAKIEWVLANRQGAETIRAASHRLITTNHTYADRAEQLLAAIRGL